MDDKSFFLNSVLVTRKVSKPVGFLKIRNVLLDESAWKLQG